MSPSIGAQFLNGGVVIKTGKSARLLIYLFVIVLSSAMWVTVTAAAESGDHIGNSFSGN
jgi:hypothetical protein